jgi:hypothetical protein
MRYLICILAVLFCASVAQVAEARPRPVRNLLKNTGKVITAPFKCHCSNGKCCK